MLCLQVQQQRQNTTFPEFLNKLYLKIFLSVDSLVVVAVICTNEGVAQKVVAVPFFSTYFVVLTLC